MRDLKRKNSLLQAVVCIGDPEYKSIAIAFAVLQEGADPQKEKDAITSHVSSSLPVYCVPKRIGFIKNLPMTPIGKVDYPKLEAMAKEIMNN